MTQDATWYLWTACRLAAVSPDPRTQNGAVLMHRRGVQGTSSVNAWPRSVRGTWERPAKYYYVEHAERAALLYAARAGMQTSSATLYCPWAACADCARAIVTSGVRRLVRLANVTSHNQWSESTRVGDQIMRDSDVEIVEIVAEYAQGGLEWPSFLRDGRMWNPVTGFGESGDDAVSVSFV